MKKGTYMTCVEFAVMSSIEEEYTPLAPRLAPQLPPAPSSPRWRMRVPVRPPARR